MRPCPSTCEWYRGCPNQALIYYAFSDRWLCDYCIGYTRIGRSVCSYHDWRPAICVDVVTQNWYCETHAQQCEALVERPAGRRSGGAHGCLQRALRQDSTGHWYCEEHGPVRPSTPPPSSPLSFIATPAPAHPVLQPLNLPPSSPALISPTYAIPTQRVTPTLATQSGGIVAQIANAISAISSVLISPGRETASEPSIAPVSRNNWRQVPLQQQTNSWDDLDDFSTVVDTECCICLDTHRSLRRLIACDHMFCEPCLQKQVNSRHARAYYCALCRKNFFEIPGLDYLTF